MSSLKPGKYHEFLVRVYYDPKDQTHRSGVQQEAKNCFHKWCKNPQNKFIDCDNSDSGNLGNCATISAFVCIYINVSILAELFTFLLSAFLFFYLCILEDNFF